MKKTLKILFIVLIITIIFTMTFNVFINYQKNIYFLKKELLSLTNINYNEIYTTNTYNEFNKYKEQALEAINNRLVSVKNLQNIKRELVLSINNLKIAKYIKYRVTFSAKIRANNCVGNDWKILYKTKNKIINNNSEIIFKLNDNPFFECEIIEEDKFPDIGTTEFVFNSTINTITKEVEIKENKGKYKNNIAIWEIKGTLTVEEYL